jgi:hypothetical protein
MVAVNVTDAPDVAEVAGLAVTVVVVAVGPDPPPDTGEVNELPTWVHVVPLIEISALA